MAEGVRVPYAEAFSVAQDLYGQLDPPCARLAIAGSLRRQRPDVGDIEFVAVPRFYASPASLWGDTEERSALDDKLAILTGARPDVTHSAILERLAGGSRYVKLRHLASGLQVDLFITTEAAWGLILLIRTGPAAYSQWLVTEARRRGFHVAHGRLFGGQGHVAGVECRCTAPLDTPSEESVYATLRLPFEAPELRLAR